MKRVSGSGVHDGQDPSRKYRTLFTTQMVAMYVPASVLLAAVVLFPFISGVPISFTNWNGFSPRRDFVGLANYLRLFTQSEVLEVTLTTFFYMIASTVLQQVLGISYALFLNHSFRGRNFIRMMVYMPVLISPLVMGYLWTFILGFNGGVLNGFLALFGQPPRLWLTDPNLGRMWILLINTLQFVGLPMLIYLAGLQNIPDMYYEAASLDGASRWQKTARITLPLLYPALLTSVTLNVIGGLKIYDSIVALTGGGPGHQTMSLSVLIATRYLGYEQAGFASALGIYLLALILVCVFMVQVIFKKLQYEN